MRRGTTVLFLFLVVWPYVKGQQLAQYSQFMFNDYVLNPAVAGTVNHYQIRANSRFQWTGILDAPQTVSFSVFGPHSSKPMGFGGYILNDITGPTSRTGLYGSYAYNVGLTDDVRLSMGLSVGILQNKVDGTKITLFEEGDQALQSSVYSSLVPDAAVGIYAYAEKWYAGFSAFQLFANSLKVYNEKNGLNKLTTHFYLMGGYRWQAAEDWLVEPSFFYKKTKVVPAQLDLSARVTYMEKVWFGASWRSSDAVALLVGYIHAGKYYFGYSYDIGINEIRRYNSGTHEIMVGVHFNDLK